jgi:hypothetical protein
MWAKTDSFLLMIGRIVNYVQPAHSSGLLAPLSQDLSHLRPGFYDPAQAENKRYSICLIFIFIVELSKNSIETSEAFTGMLWTIRSF